MARDPCIRKLTAACVAIADEACDEKLDVTDSRHVVGRHVAAGHVAAALLINALSDRDIKDQILREAENVEQ